MSSIEDKKNKKKGNNDDVDYDSFYLHSIGLIVTAIILSFFSALFMQNLSRFSRNPLGGTKLYGPPYTPEGARSFHNQSGGSNVFSKMFEMDKWAFPYKNSFTVPFPKTEQEAKSNWWWRIGSWVTMSIAFSFANGRRILQEIFSGLNTVTRTGKFANLKSNLLFTHSQFIVSLIILLVPLYSIISSIYALGKNAYKLFPNNFWLFLLALIPMSLFALGAGSIIVTGVTMAQIIMILVFLLIYPLVTSDGLAEIGQCLYEKRNLITNQILFFMTILAFYDLDTTKGLVFLLVFLGFFFKLIA